MGWKGVLRCISLVAAVVAAPGLRSAAAGEDGLNPPLKGMAERKDKDGYTSMRLPELAKDMGPGDSATITRWAVWFYEDPGNAHLNVYIRHKPGFSRVRLFASQTDSYRLGKLDAGSVVKGDHTWQETRTTEAGRARYHLLEAEGCVFEVVFSCTAPSFAILPRHMDALFASFKVLKAPAAQPPEGFRVVETSSRRIWTDVKSKADVDKVAAAHAAMWSRMNPLLPPLSSSTEAPLLIVCRDEKSYAEAARGSYTGPVPSHAFIDFNRRAAIVGMADASKKRSEFDRQLERIAGVHAVQSAYGGKVPYWVEDGLALLGVFTTARGTTPEKPNPDAVRLAKQSVKKRGRATLEVLIDTPNPVSDDPVLAEDGDREMWAWHWYLNDAGAQEDAKRRYREYLRILGETGDVQDARAVWNGTDWAALDTAFETWLAAR